MQPPPFFYFEAHRSLDLMGNVEIVQSKLLSKGEMDNFNTHSTDACLIDRHWSMLSQWV